MSYCLRLSHIFVTANSHTARFWCGYPCVSYFIYIYIYICIYIYTYIYISVNVFLGHGYRIAMAPLKVYRPQGTSFAVNVGIASCRPGFENCRGDGCALEHCPDVSTPSIMALYCQIVVPIGDQLSDHVVRHSIQSPPKAKRTNADCFRTWDGIQAVSMYIIGSGVHLPNPEKVRTARCSTTN